MNSMEHELRNLYKHATWKIRQAIGLVVLGYLWVCTLLAIAAHTLFISSQYAETILYAIMALLMLFVTDILTKIVRELKKRRLEIELRLKLIETFDRVAQKLTDKMFEEAKGKSRD